MVARGLETLDLVESANLGLVSSALHKQQSWMTAFAPYPTITTTPIVIRRGAPEPDCANPKATAVGKLQKFAGLVDGESLARRLDPTATATVLDVLFVVDKEVLTTDRGGEGASPTIANLGQKLRKKVEHGMPAQIEIYSTTGTARVRDIARYGEHLPPELIFAAWTEGSITLSPALVKLLVKPKALFKLREQGLVGSDVINPHSIASIHWAALARWVPQIARNVRGGTRDISMELQLGTRRSYYLSAATPIGGAEQAERELDVFARGVAPSIAQGIMGFYLQ